MEDQDNSVFRRRIANILREINGFSGLVEEYGVSREGSGGVIDILVKYRSNNKVTYFVIECKDYRDGKIIFPQSPISDLEKFNWGLYYRFLANTEIARHDISTIKPRPTYYSTDLAYLANGKKTPDSDLFYKWTTQASSNFMRFLVEERDSRQKKTAELEEYAIFPILVCGSVMEVGESITVNPHPFTSTHLAVDINGYAEPLTRGELKKGTFLFVHTDQLASVVKKLVNEISAK